MIVCHCNGVSDHTIRRAVRGGAVTAQQVARACGAGASCGGCREAVREILYAELELSQPGNDASASASASPAR